MARSRVPLSPRPLGVATLALIAALIASAAGSQTLLPGLPGVNGRVNALAVVGNTLYLGGSFTEVGRHTGPGAMLEGGSGVVSRTSPMFKGANVAAVCDDGAGGWFVGGSFAEIGGRPRTNLAHIGADGSVTSWNPTANGTVRALVRDGNTLFVGGDFTVISFVARSRLAAYDVGTGFITSWSPGADNSVQAMAVSDHTVYVGGSFSQLAGQPRSFVGAVDEGTGAATSWAPTVSGAYVQALALGATSVYMSGAITAINGAPRADLGAADLVSGATTPWNPSPDGGVFALVVSGNGVFAGGNFSHIGGAAMHAIARLDGDAGVADASWNAACDVDGVVWSMQLDGNSLLAAGSFSVIGGQLRGDVASLALANAAAGPWRPRPNGEVRCIARSGGQVFIGGLFTRCDKADRVNLASVDMSTLRVTDWQPVVPGEVLSLVSDGHALFVGGAGVAAFDVATGSRLPFDARVNQGSAAIPEVWAMTLSAGTLRLGGGFGNLGAITRSNVAAVDAVSGAVLPWAPEANSVVRGLAETPTGVFLDGFFSMIGGQPRALLAQVDGVTGAPTSWQPPVFSGAYRANGVYQNPAVYSLAVDGDRLYVGGQFAGPRANAVCLDAGTGAVQAWNPPGYMVTEPVQYGTFAFLPSPEVVYVGQVGTPAGGLMALDPATGQPVPSSPPFAWSVRAIARWGPNIVFGGEFTDVGGTPADGLAILLDPSVLDVGDGARPAQRLALSPPSPLPARAVSHVTLSLPEAARVSAGLIDVSGRLARTVIGDAAYPAGRHDLALELAGLSPGIYWLSVRAGGEQVSRKVVVSR